MGDLKSKKFRMRVNNKIYDVYPDLMSILKQNKGEFFAKNNKKMTTDDFKTDEMAKSIPVGRAAILKDYYEVLLAQMKKEAKTGGKLTEAQLKKAIQNSIKAYAEQLAADSDASRAKSAIAELKQEFAEQEKQYSEIHAKAQSHANLMLKLGFLGSLSQLIGFTLGIYVIYDWNEMEPYTWIVCKY